MAPFLDDRQSERQEKDLLPLKLKLEGFIAGALDIRLQKLRKQSHKTWLALGGDSLTAVNFMGFCHDAGISVDIPDILQSESIDDLINRIAKSHQSTPTSSNGIKHSYHNGSSDEYDDLLHYGAPKGPLWEEIGASLGYLDDIEGIAPCSPMQENFIALQSIDIRAYQLLIAARVSSTNPAVALTTSNLQKCWRAVVKRHTALRTMFVESVDRPGKWVQVVKRNIDPQISVLSTSEAENRTSFDGYSSKFPHHLILAQAPEQKLLVRLNISHAIADGMSIQILFRDLCRELTGNLPAGESLPCGGFLRAQQPDTSRETLTYWMRYMRAIEGTFLSSPSSKSKPTGLYMVDQYAPIPSEMTQDVREGFNATLVNACQVAYAMVLRSLTGANSVCFSYTASGRQKRIKGLQDAPGNFVNTLPCHVDFSDTTTIADALNRVQTDFLASLPYQGANLTDSQEMRGGSVRQLGDSLLSFQREAPETDFDNTGIAVHVDSWEAPTDYHYTLAISFDRNRLGLRLSVWDSLTCSEDAHNMMQLFRDSLDFVLRNASKLCSDFVGITSRDQSKIIAFNGNPPTIPRNCIHSQVSAVTRRQPNVPAICAWDGELTYSELDTMACRLAAYLIHLDMKFEENIGVCMDKSLCVPVAMLAILKAGGVVVPLGNQDPLIRIQNIAHNANIAILMTDRVHAKRLEGIATHTIILHTNYLNQLPSPKISSWPNVSPDNAAWIVHTSGSTGVPKGVVLEHKTLCATMHVQAARYNMGPSTRALQFSAHTFDVVVKDIFTTLSFGGIVCIPSERQRLDNLGKAIQDMRVNFATLTPTVASLLDLRDLPNVDTIVLTGEALKPAVIKPWLEQHHVKWFNGYGPSECSHVSTINGPITCSEDASNIGFPAANCLWVTDPLDPDRLSPIGATGELLIEGAIAREYLHDPAKTAASFVVDPGFTKRLGLTPGRRMYRTGDLVRQNKDDSLTYLGRRDTQIKIQGQRVEVGEIESRISLLLPSNPRVCVDLVQSRNGSSILMAAIDMQEVDSNRASVPGTLCEASGKTKNLLQNIQSDLTEQLPLYMVPSHFVPFKALLTNSSAKLDRLATRKVLEALTETELASFHKYDSMGTISTNTEMSLQTVWAEVLGHPIADIGCNSHFMQLGGDSVVAMRMAAVARRKNIPFSVADVIQHPRLGDLARIVDGYNQAALEAAKKDPIPFELWNGFLGASAEQQRARLASVANQCKTSPSQVEDIYPTSPLQEGLMAMTTQFPETYVAQIAYRIDPKVDLEHFQKVWADVARLLPILRTRIIYTPDSGSLQVVTRDAPQWTTASDLSKFVKADHAASFAYGTPLNRFAIVYGKGQDERYFVWTIHHSTYDGPTISRTLKMLVQVHQGRPCEAVTPIPRFIRYLERNTQNEGWERSKIYWQQQLKDAHLTRFPKSLGPSYQPFANGVQRHYFELENASRKGSRVSLAILLRAAWALVVGSRTGSDEAMLAVILSGRNVPVFGIEDVVAPTIATVPVRIPIDRKQTIVDFLASVDSQNTTMEPYAQFGLTNIRREVADLGHDFDPGHLFVVQFRQPPEDIIAAETLGIKGLAGERQNFEGYALVVECMLDARGTGIEIEMHFDKDVLSSSRVQDLMFQLEHLARELQPYNLSHAALDVAQRNATIGNIDLITPDDKKKLLSWNRPPPDAVQVTLDELVGDQIARSPQAVAICTRNCQITYARLDATAHRLAQHLVSAGVGPETLVGLCMEKSELAVISMLAVLRAGGAVVPLGIQLPNARLKTLVEDSKISIVLVDIAQAKRFVALVSNPILVNASLLDLLPAPHTPMLSRASPSSPAWVIFTSGSTGVPKGVVLEHQALCSGILASGVRYGVTTATRNFQFSAFTFDVSITDIFITLVYGGCVCMPSEKDRTDDVESVMNDLAVTFAVLTPTVTSMLDLERVPSSLDTVVFVGEAIKPAAVKPWVSRVKVFNGYGPAECSIYSVINGPVLRPEDAPIIGSTVSNRLWLTDPSDHNSLVPIGTPGELLIEGPALARCYLNDSEKTAKSFVLDPHFIRKLRLSPGRRMYRTGDLVQQNCDDGSFVCLGRLDTQIKIRGQRVEVGEIESQIVRLQPEIKQACVELVRLRNVSDQLLLAGVEIPRQHDDELDVTDTILRPSPRTQDILGNLRSDLLQILPLYMIPSYFIPMSFPVNASGKLDRRTTRTVLEGLSREQLRAFVTDRENPVEDRMLSETEEQLRILWAQVLDIPAEGIGGANDDFFELGGDSVTAMRLVAAAQTAPKPLHLGVGKILTNPRLVDMARVSSEYNATEASAAEADPEPFELWRGFKDADVDKRKDWLTALAEQCEGLAGADEIVDVYPCTSLQEGMMAMTSHQTSAYVAQQVFRIGADVDVSRLQRAWQIMSDRLAILRTCIVYTAQGSVQVVVRKATQWEDVNGLSSYLTRDQSKPFAYGTPLHRLAIVQDATGPYFVWTVHHAAYDGWSLLLVSRMLAQIYRGEKDSFVQTPTSRFIKYLQQKDEDATAVYWRNQLGDAQLVRFPPRPSAQYQPYASNLLQTRLHGFSEQYRSDRSTSTVSLGSLLRAAWATTLATYTGTDEAIVNISLSGRDAPVEGIANIVAPTITTVPVRIKIDKKQSVTEFLAAVDQQAKEMVAFEHTGLHQIRNAVLGLDSDFDAGHLFIVQPAVTDGEQPAFETIGLELTTTTAEGAESRDFGGYALATDCTINADSVDIEIRYDSNVLPQSRAETLMSHFEHTIRQLKDHGRGSSMAELDFTGPADADLIQAWNQRSPSTKQACIHDLIQLVVDKSPDSQAIDAWDGQFSYATLHATARRLAHHLISHCGVGPEIKVGLCMNKSCWAVISILSILMAGGVVVPLGVQQPLIRVSTIAQDSEVSTMLVDADQATRLSQLPNTPPHLIIVDTALLSKLQTPTATERVCDSVSPDNAAWIVYTSGSTGVPKGIVLEHKALCSSFQAHGPRVGFSADTRALQFSAYTFDNCIEDILSVLTFGGCVCVPSEDQRMNALTDTIRSMNANLLNTTSTVASLIRPNDVPMLKTLLLGGEAVSTAVVEQWLGYAEIINTYGPAECSVDVACSVPMKQPCDASTIGLPLGVCFWVTSVSNYNRLVPIGTPGELLIEGPHLGREYLNDPGKTTKAFVWDPDFVTQLGISSGRRMYRTGDLVQQNPDGSLVHLGRIDTQIKIRGQRVETGEIESNIVQLRKEVRIACVDLIRPSDESNDPMLVAAIDVDGFGNNENDNLQLQTVRKPTDALRTLIRDLRASLLQVLPRYMVPLFIPMTSLPLNASSKLDRQATRDILGALSRAQLGAFERPTQNAEDRVLSPMEERLRRIWVEVLGCSPDIKPHDDFVQLGGDSVTAMRLVAAAQGAKIRIGVADILQNPHLSDLALVAEKSGSTAEVVTDPAPFELWDGFSEADEKRQQAWLSEVAKKCGVTPQDIEDVYPGTALQEGLMAVTAQQPGAYVTHNIFRIRGTDMTRFKEAWSKLMSALTILRTRIVYHNAQAGSIQVVVRGELEWIQANDLQTYIAKDKAIPFAYGTPLHRLAIVEADQSDYFVWSQHHSGYDGYQMALTLGILAQIYQDAGERYQQPPPIPRFINYLKQADKKQVANYWRQQLEDAHLTRFPPLPHPSYHPHGDGLLKRRVQRSRPYNGAPASILLRAAWAITVATFTGSNDATSTVALSGRDIPVSGIGNMVVPTMATVPMRTRLDNRTQLVSELFAAMGRQNEEMKPFLHTGMQHIRAAVPELGVDYDPGHLFIIQPEMGNEDNDSILETGLEPLAIDKTDFGGYALAVDCTINLDATVGIELQYDSKVIPVPMAEALLSQFEYAVQQLDIHSNTIIGDLDLFKPADVERVRKWNQPVLKATSEQSCIHELVQTVVERQPNAPAVLSWDGAMSYLTLCKIACRLAHHLVSLGVGPEVTVGVCMDKSIWAMVSMLAILQSGGVVVALGTQHPLSRIKTIIADADIKVNLIDKAQAKRLGSVSHPIVVDGSFVDQLPAHALPPSTSVKPENAAWIVYTSGSTGTPKGVVLEHQSLCTGIIAHGTLFGNNTRTRALQFASHTFGVVIEDMFTTLIFGGCTCIPSEDERLNMKELESMMRRMHVNFVNLTSTAASLIDPHEVPEIETVVLGGEAVRPAVVEMWAKHARILNAYGQSECSVESVIGLVEHEEDAMKIGTPIGRSAAWVVDTSDCNRLVPVGAPGELLIQGPLLARGYLNDAHKTAASFVSDPAFLTRLGFSSKHGSRMYRTGDLVQQNEDGSLMYLGRCDGQIKVRGQRVEPGEIESRIVQLHPEISHAFVGLVRPRDQLASADLVLAAAVELPELRNEQDRHDSPPAVQAPTQDLALMIQRMRTALIQNLPPYMVPSYIVPVSGHLPVNASGKLDRRATRAILDSLSRDQLAAFSKVKIDANRPLSATEEQLQAAYAEVLGCSVNEIGPEDQFVQLGGDSVAAMHVVAACRQRGMIVTVRDVLLKQSIAALNSCVKMDDIAHGLNGALEESSDVTEGQEWMLNHHVARPDVGMTYFALDAKKPLIGQRMAEACRTLLLTMESLHTCFIVEHGKWKRVVPSAPHPIVQTYITDITIGEWTENFIQREGYKPLDANQPLVEIAICTSKQNGEHRILIRMSHVIWDGMCITQFWSALKDLYETGQAKRTATFSQYVAEVDKRRTPQASKYWSEVLNGATMTPIENRKTQGKEHVFRAGLIGPKRIELGQNLPPGTTCAVVLKAAWALVLARLSKRDDVVFAELVSGRAGVDSSVANAMGCCSTPMPVRIKMDASMTYIDLVHWVQKQQLDSMPFETYGFRRIAQECTDWPADTWATSWINHVPSRIASKFEIDGTEYTISQPKQEEQNWTFSETRISWLNEDDTLEFSLAYAVDRVSERVAKELSDGLVVALQEIFTSPKALIGKFG